MDIQKTDVVSHKPQHDLPEIDDLEKKSSSATESGLKTTFKIERILAKKTIEDVSCNSFNSETSLPEIKVITQRPLNL